MPISFVTKMYAGAEERRQRFKTVGKAGKADSDAKAAEHASDMASKAAKSAAASAAAAKADAETEKSTEVRESLPIADMLARCNACDQYIYKKCIKSDHAYCA